MGKIELYDTTLRDGAQSEGISFSTADKMKICEKLDSIGIHFIEAGWPGSNPKDEVFFRSLRKLKLRTSKIAAFGSTCRAHTSPAKDPVFSALVRADTEYVTIFGKSWDLHVREVLKTDLATNLKMIEASVSCLKKRGKTVFFDAEHFFDGYTENPEYAMRAVKAAEEAGADRIILCDTNGGALTARVFEIVEEVKESVRAPLGIHVHNDGDMAVANSIAAVQAGCIQIHGTINGYGERCGNANLISIIALLKLKMKVDCISNIALKELSEASRYVAEIANMKLQDNQPFVGSSAFAHKAGVHINAIMKNARSYEHVEPEAVGNSRRFLISELSGKSSILKRAEVIEPDLARSAKKAEKILGLLKERESKGYQYEAAEASLEILMRRAMKNFKDFFLLEDFRVIIEKRAGRTITSEATLRVRVGEKVEHAVSLGDGPVNALDNALRKALAEFYPSLASMHLSDFKVRVLDEKEGTAARVRVLIESQDPDGSWWTVGVSENIIEASWQALIDSIEYKLLKDSRRADHKKAA